MRPASRADCVSLWRGRRKARLQQYFGHVRARLSRLARDPRWQDASDILIALVLAGTSVAGVLRGQTDWGTSEGAALFLALASTAPVAWRSRYPLSCAGVVLLANAGCV